MASPSSTTPDRRALLALSRREWALLGAAAILLPATTAALKVFGYGRVERWSRQAVPLRRPKAGEAGTAATTARVVRIAAGRLPVPSRCLAQSIVLRTLLRAQGVDSQLRIGVRLAARDLSAHAWVEHAGRPLNDTADVAERYGPLPLPPA